MPEGDTVWLTAHRLDLALAGRRLERAELRVPAYATTRLTGATVIEVRARGKHILARLDDGRTLHSHLRMDGSWRLFDRGRPWRGGPAHHVRAVLSTAQSDAVGYRIHDVTVLPTGQEVSLVGHLGPDLLGADWDADEAVRRLRAAPHRQIGPALLDQRILAGIGTLYGAETLFLGGVDPWTPVGAVGDPAGLVRTARHLLRANRDHWAQSTTGSIRRGQEHWVFERQRHPCRRCGSKIRVGEQGDPPYARLVYWCPHCQPAAS